MTDWSSPDAGRGVGPDFFGTNYPFVRPSQDVSYVLSDFWLAYSDATVAPPLYVQSLFHFGRALSLEPPGPTSQHQSDLTIIDSTNRVICDTRLAAFYKGRAWGTRFYIHEWIFPDKVCRVVQQIKLIVLPAPGDRETEAADLMETEDLDQRIIEQLVGIPIVLSPISGELDIRTYERMPGRVASIQVGSDVLYSNVVLVPGYNMAIDVNGSSSRLPSLTGSLQTTNPRSLDALQSTILLSAIAGAGLGAYPGCAASESGLLTINNTIPDAAGNFTIGAAGCLGVFQPPLLSGGGNVDSAIRFTNQCKVCCSCADYLSIYNEEAQLTVQLTRIGLLLSGATDAYTENLAIWQNMVNSANILKAEFTDPQRYQSSVLQTMPTFPWVAVCHVACTMPTDHNWKPLRLVVHFGMGSTSFNTPPAALSLDTGQSFGDSKQSDSDTKGPIRFDGAWPMFTIDWDWVAGGTTVNAWLYLRLPAMSTYTGTEFSLTASVTAESPPGTSLGVPSLMSYAPAAAVSVDGDAYVEVASTSFILPALP